MSERKRLGLKIMWWIATVILGNTINDEERDSLETLRVSLSVKDLEDTHE